MSKSLSTSMNFDETAIGKIDSKEISSLFHMLNGKPDSVLKVFTRTVNITIDDIMDLESQIKDKFKQYRINCKIDHISVRFENNLFKEFNDWVQFRDQVKINSNPIENINLSWDAMLDMDGYCIPQRHTITVRLSSAMKPSQILQMMLNGNIEDMDSIDKNAFPVMCKVDCVNNRIGEEVIQIVHEWNKGLEHSFESNKKFKFLKKHKNLVAQSIKYSFFFVSMFIITALICIYIKKVNIVTFNELHIKTIAIASPFLYIFLELSKRIGIYLAEKTYESLYNYGEYHTFNISNGDKNKQKSIKEANNQNKKTALKLSATILYNIIISIIASVIANTIA